MTCGVLLCVCCEMRVACCCEMCAVCGFVCALRDVCALKTLRTFETPPCVPSTRPHV